MSGVRITELHKSYGRKQVLRGLSAVFERDRIAAVVGPNGAGKTTLLRIMAGLQHADQGTVECDGALYYGGCDLMPRHGTMNQLRTALGLEPLPEGDRKLSTSSRGELQHCGLGIALDLKRDVLLLDEPWTALEPDLREDLSERLRAESRGRVILCSSHDLDEVARLADDVFFMFDGRVSSRRREDHGGAFDREDLVRTYRSGR